MRILVAIANHGTGNRAHLEQLLKEYCLMRHQVDVVVLSNIPKHLGAHVEVIVGLPSKDPWSLPFAHKQVLAERVNDYDLFVYSEDDTLITQRNIDAFLKATEVLPETEIAGFLRTEQAADGALHFPEVHDFFHWDSESVRRIGSHSFAHFTDEHSACFMLTRKQLQRAIASGGFLVPPHEGRYDLMVTAATDPYTQCGFRKMICISHLDDFTVPHLPNKYIGRIGLPEVEVRRQIDALMQLETNGRSKGQLFPTETKLPRCRWSKSYYEVHCPQLTALIPEPAKDVLSIGMGSGDTEEYMLRKGKHVAGIPLDSVIAACAEARGVEVVYGGFDQARTTIGERRFNCVIFSNVLHLLKDPVAILRQFVEVLADGGMVVAMVPNLAQLPVAWRRLSGKAGYADCGKYDRTGIQATSAGWLQNLFHKSGLHANSTAFLTPERHRWASLTLGKFHRGLVASDIIMSATR